MGENEREALGPVSPLSTQGFAQFPLGVRAVKLDPTGALGAWQQQNATATLPYVVEQMETSGVLPNLRRVLDGAGIFRGMWFADSDLYKTLEALGWEAVRTGTRTCATQVDEWIDLLARVQDQDGYLNSYFQTSTTEPRWSNMIWGHELYCAGHLIQAAVAWAHAGDGRLLGIATAFADHIVDVFGPNGRKETAGHPEIETALVELYRVTGTEAYLNQARLFLNRRGTGQLHGPNGISTAYYQDDIPVRAATEARGHAVRQMYLLAGMIDVATETGNTELLDAAARVYHDALDTKTYLTGGQGARHRDESFGDAFELPPDRAYAETCAAIASFQVAYRLLLATGNSRYAFEMERVLHNGILSGVDLHGTSFFYSNPLQLRTCHRPDNEDSPSERLAWYTCACCPPNLARLSASLDAYVATHDARSITLQLPASATLTAAGPGWQTTLTTQTDAPDGARVATVITASHGTWTLRIRIPAGARELHTTINGQRAAATPTAGYVELTRQWQAGDVVVVQGTAHPQAIHPHPQLDAVRGCVALTKGALVYCVENADLPDGVTVEDLRVTPAALAQAETVDVPELGTRGLRFQAVAEAAADVALYRANLSVPHPKPITAVAVPYARWANRGPGGMRVWLPIATTNNQ